MISDIPSVMSSIDTPWMPDPENRLLPTALDALAANAPNDIFASFPSTDEPEDGFEDFTNEQVVCAIDSFAWSLHDEFGPSGTFETLAYIGVSDLRYLIFFYGCVKVGYKSLFFSSRNTAQQNASLFVQSGCRQVFFSTHYRSHCQALQRCLGEALELRHLEDFQTWASRYNRPYPYTKSYTDARLDPVVVLHSSGSTGPPKTVTQNHQFFINIHRPLQPPEGKQSGGYALWNFSEPGFAFSPFPFYHLAGMQSICVMPVFYRFCSAVCGPPNKPVTSEMLLSIMKQRAVHLLYSPPSLIEGLLRLPEASSCLRKLNDILYAGGPLSKAAGDTLITMARVSTCYGFTETAGLACLVPEQANWDYLEFHPSIDFTMEPALDDAFEMILKKSTRMHQLRGIDATILQTEKQYRSKDLFIRHPNVPGLWRYFGRQDDIIVFSNGQKWNPLPTESIVSSHPDVAGALVVGSSRCQAALLVEHRESDSDSSLLLESIWPLVRRANKQTNPYGQVLKSKVMFFAPGSFLRTAKGTVQRKSTCESLRNAIELLYAEPQNTSPSDLQPPSNPIWSSNTLLELVRCSVQESLDVPSLGDGTDLFIAGLSSINAIEISRLISQGLSTYFDPEKLSFIRISLVFRHPTIERLTNAILLSLYGRRINLVEDVSDYDLLTKYRVEINNIRQLLPNGKRAFSVAISGTTGSLGSYLLEMFLQSLEVTLVICLNRSSDAENSARKTLTGLAEPAWDKTIFWKACLQDPNLGLQRRELEQLSEVDAVLHCAWTVNFNQPVTAFEPQIQGVANLLRLVSSASRFQRMFFISSTSSVSQHELGIIPEEVAEPGRESLSLGYGRSKYISESILARASKTYNIPVTILRVGQIAGPEPPDQASYAPNKFCSRPWSNSEWLPAMIATSKNLDQIPIDLSPVNWIPVTKLVSIMFEIVVHDLTQQGLKIYNLVNSSESEWLSLLPSIVSYFPGCKAVPFREWLNLLRQQDSNTREALEKYPALKILPFLEERQRRSHIGMQPRFCTENAARTSKAFTTLSPTGPDQMRFWMRQWGYEDVAHHESAGGG